MTGTLIGGNEGVYHPALFNDRLLLGLKGNMSEAELYIIRARLDGGIRHKAARRTAPRVDAHMAAFEACSSFTRALRPARCPPMVDFFTRFRLALG